MERRLAAVLIADVVGYGRLSQIDEEGTRARFQADLKEVFEPKVAAHRGRLVKTMGDGLLVEFSSVVDALRCAVEAQQEKARRNALAPPAERLDFRVGVNLGDVIVEGDDIHGDGVNIADRMQGLAEPAGVAISGTAYDQVKAKLPVGYVSIGEQKVKSIAEPVRVYRLLMDPAAAGKTVAAPRPRAWRIPAAAAGMILVLALATAAWWRPWQPAAEVSGSAAQAAADTRPSLVVLPFDNLSDDKEQGYLADGLTEDLTTELARVPGLFVISRNAAFTYKGRSVAPAQIAEELGVRYILEGSTRRAGDDMRLNAQLIDAQTGGHVWAERFDGEWANVFALQDEVVASIAGALELRLVAGHGKADIAGGTANPAAYDAFLRGKELYLRGAPEDMVEAVDHFRQALALDPDFGMPSAHLAWVYWDADPQRAGALGLSWEEVDAGLYESLDAAARRPSPPYYRLIADLLVREHKSDEAIAVLQKAVALDPSDPWTYEGLSQALIFNGRPKDGRAYLDAAMRVDPGWGDWRYYQAGLAAFGESRFEDAAALLEKIDLEAPNPWPKFYGLQVLISAYGHLERGAEIAATKESFERILKERDEGKFTRLLTHQFFVFKNESDIARLLDGLAKAGVPELPSDFDPDSKDRLTGPEIKTLIFGNELRGRRIAPEVADYEGSISMDGSFSSTVGSSSSAGTIWIQADVRCAASPRNLTTCGAIFRNPSGTFEKKNEYLTVQRHSRFEFSVVD